jgi:hypothetical protein
VPTSAIPVSVLHFELFLRGSFDGIYNKVAIKYADISNLIIY